MGLTVSNPNTLRLLSIINRTTAQQKGTLTRLSTGLRINRAADDPAGLIALSVLDSELAGVNTAIANNQRTDSLLGVADGALTEVSSLLGEIKSLVLASTSSAGLTAAEQAANQAQIDAAIESIDRIVRTTTFNGKRLLDGTMAIATTGATASQITDIRVFSRAQLAADTAFTVQVTASATRAEFTLVSTGGNVTSGATSFALTGTLGTATISVASGSSAAQIATQINLAKDLTGLSASVSSNSVVVRSTGFGSDDFLGVDVLSGGNIAGGSASFNETSGNVTGTDAAVLVNGQRASVDGLSAYFSGSGFAFSFNLTEGFGTQTTTQATFTVRSSGGATFQLGPVSGMRSTIGLGDLYSHRLGGGDVGGVLSDLKSGGSASLTGDIASALRIADQAINDVAQARGRIGAFQKYQVQTSINSLNAAKLGLTSARSAMGDADFAVETAELNRQNLLLSSAVSLLALANQQSGLVLTLLSG